MTRAVLSPITTDIPATTTGLRRTRSRRPALALALIVAVSMLGSLYWLRINELFVGHDSTSYITTLHDYLGFLSPPSLGGLFEAFVYPAYRTPGLYLAAYPFYAIFGPSADAAQLANVLLLGVLIVLTYRLTREFAPPSISLLAAVIVALLPLVAGMARLFYTEMLLTTLVTLNLLALLRSRGFAHRTWALVWGASLGLGLLAKWTMPIYIALPTLWVLAQPAWRGAQWRALRSPQWPHWGRAAISAAGGIAFALLWYLPNRDLARTFPLGDWTALAWAMLTALLICSLLSLRGPVSHWWAAVLIAVWIASLWYLPRIDIIDRLRDVDVERGQESAGLLNPDTYWQYARYFYIQHLGPLLFWLMVPATALSWLLAWRGRRTPSGSAVLWLSLLSALAVLVILSQRNARNLVPLLPIFAVLAALALSWLPRPLRLGLGAAWIALLVAQWSLITFDAPAAWRTPSLWVNSEYAVPPASGPTNPAYAIGPRILDQITAAGAGPHSLGVLVNTHQLHPGLLRYAADLAGAPVEILDLTDLQPPPWQGAIGSQWLLWKDGSNNNVEPPGQEVLAAISAGNPLFDALYTRAAAFGLPDGDTVYLLHRREGPGFPLGVAERMQAAALLAESAAAATSPHSTLVYASPDLAVWVGLQRPQSGPQIVLRGGAAELDVLAASASSPLTGTVLALVDGDTHDVESWFDARAFRALSVTSGDEGLVVYGFPAAPPEEIPAEAVWENLQLESLRSHPHTQAGMVLPLELAFEGNLDPNRKLSYRLVGPDGAVLAASDRALAATDRFGLFVPPTTPPGVYNVVALLYDAQTQAVLTDRSGNGEAVLFTVSVDQ